MTETHVGFTGTRHGMSDIQMSLVAMMLARFVVVWGPGLIVHHGDCIGADATFFRLAREAQVGSVVCHPPSGRSRRAFVGGDVMLEVRPPLDRNTAIVRSSSWMIATPLEMTEQTRGGTWSTIRKARAWGRPLFIAWRDGSISRERWPSAGAMKANDEEV